MSNEVQTANAGADQKPVGKANISASELIAARFKAMSAVQEAQNTPKAEGKPPEQEAQAEPEQPKEEIKSEENLTSPEEAKANAEQDVLSKEIDLANMSEAELKELAQKLGSKAVARFGELTAKRKAAEEQLAALKAELEKREESTFEAKVKDNPYANINTKDELDTKYQEIVEVMEWAENHLDKSEDLAADDVVASEGGKDYTKRELREVLRRARKARDVFIPDQGKQLKLQSERQSLKNTLVERAKQELPWLNGEDNDVRKQYEIMMGDDKLRAIERAAPDLAPRLPYLLAHAANSIYGKRVEVKQSSPRLSPPTPVITESVESNTPASRQNKALKDIADRFGKSGGYKDFIKLRSLQHSQ